MSTRNFLMVATIVLVVFFVASFASNINKMFRRWFGGDPEIDHAPTPVPPGGTNTSFDPTFYVSRLRQTVLPSLADASPRCQAYRSIMELNDTEFVIVLNEFLEESGVSLRAAMDNTWQSGCSLFSTQWDRRVYDRMDYLQVRG